MGLLKSAKSKLSSAPPEIIPAHTKFFGPDATRQIVAHNANGYETAKFMIAGDPKSFTLSRLTSPTTSPVEICKAKHSSLTASTKITVHGETELKFQDSLSTLTLDTSVLGKLTWKSDSLVSSRTLKLTTSDGKVIAIGTTKDDLCLEIIEQMDDLILDVLLAGWVATLYYLTKTRKINSIGLEVMATLVGLPTGP